MCGVAGIYGYHPDSPEINRDELIRIRDHMAARGPDGKGAWVSEGGHVGLAHRRLSIIDLTDDGAQPMCSPDGRYVISFNGEIYNYQELKQKLERCGYEFCSHSDTEVLIHLYAEKGEAMLNDLRGMFAFSLWDNERRCMLIARDPYGIKPLYYSDNGRTIRIASQVKAIMAGTGVSKALSPAGVAGYFLFGHLLEPFTVYQDVSALPAGSYAMIDQYGMREPVRYFELAELFDANITVSEEEARHAVYEALSESLQYHLVSDVPVGVFLSAGIDSAAILSLAGEERCRALQSVTLSFGEFSGSLLDESILAAELSAHFHAGAHKKRLLEESEFLADIDNFFDVMDQPSIDGLNTYFVSKAAAELGWKVALSGIGGDELFCGYSSFKDIPGWVDRTGLASRIPFAGELFNIAGRALFPRMGINPKAAGIVKYGGSYASAYLLKRGLFLPKELPQLLGRDMAEEGLKQLSIIRHIDLCLGDRETEGRTAVSILESSMYMRNQLLRDTDWSGMSHSLEIRTPFVDAHLVRKIAPALASQWNSPGKGLFTASLRSPLPETVASKAKTGFTTPVSLWLEQDGHLDAWKEMSCLHGAKIPWARRWAYVVARREGLL